MADDLLPQNRGATGRFVKGNNANPGGRPAVAREFKERARAYMEQEGGGWDNLLGMATDAKGRDRFQAVQLIASYAYGKPAQRLEHTGDEGQPIEIIVRRINGPRSE